jgi:hypothetical protein
LYIKETHITDIHALPLFTRFDLEMKGIPKLAKHVAFSTTKRALLDPLADSHASAKASSS